MAIMGAFDVKQYLTHATYHLCLLFASFLLLPRSTSAVQTTSTDRPEHPFLTPITAKPLKTLGWLLAGEVLCAMLWGQHLTTWSAPRIQERHARVRKTAQRLRGALTGTVVATPILGGMCALAGAPLNVHTLLFACHCALLLVWAPIQALGLPSLLQDGSALRFRYTRLFCSFRAETPLERVILHPILGGVIGGWLGAMLLALDWDRPWQTFPLPPTFGMLVGYAVGSYIL